MAYVMLSRVQCIDQLYILESLPDSKIYASNQALKELERMESISINENQSKWEEKQERRTKISSLNCQSLKNKFLHISDDPVLACNDVICFSETWLKNHEDESSLQLEGFKLHTVNVGHGKGLATYFKDKTFQQCFDATNNDLQCTKLTSKSMDVISIYQSKNGNQQVLTDMILSLTSPDKTTIVCGDFNICLRTNRHNFLSKCLKSKGYVQHVQEATHYQGGMIDHVYVKQGEEQFKVDVPTYSPYYTAFDHDALPVCVDDQG